MPNPIALPLLYPSPAWWTRAATTQVAPDKATAKGLEAPPWKPLEGFKEEGRVTL